MSHSQERRKLGRFATVNPVGLGCMGMSEFYGPVDNDQSLRVLDAALELGMDHFDTADVYGYGANEKLVGAFLQRSGLRSEVVLATKCGIVRDANDPAHRGINNSPDYIVEACNQSMERLGTHIDLFYLHRIADDGQRIGESMAAMAELLRCGKIKAVGISEAGPHTIEAAHRALLRATDGGHGLTAVQNELSPMSPDALGNGVLDICTVHGITLVAFSPLGRGFLTNSFSLPELDQSDFRRTLPRFQADNLAQNARLRNFFNELARRKNCTSAQVVMAWALAQSANIVVIPGTKKIQYLRENVAAQTVHLSPEELTAIHLHLQQSPAAGARYSPAIMKAWGLQ